MDSTDPHLPESSATGRHSFERLAKTRGHSVGLSPGRKLVNDLLWFTRSILPSTVVRNFRIDRVARAREEARVRIGWPTLFIKAYARVCAQHPELRQLLVSRPWSRLYQHPHSICRMPVSRVVDGVPSVFFLRLYAPERQSLVDLQQQIDEFKTEPVESIRAIRKQTAFSRQPWLLRAVVWWSLLNLLGYRRACRLGTFALTTLSGKGASVINPSLVGSTTLTFGPVEDDATVQVSLIFDHRVMDGGIIADALSEIEVQLNSAIAEELESLPKATG